MAANMEILFVVMASKYRNREYLVEMFPMDDYAKDGCGNSLPRSIALYNRIPIDSLVKVKLRFSAPSAGIAEIEQT